MLVEHRLEHNGLTIVVVSLFFFFESLLALALIGCGEIKLYIYHLFICIYVNVSFTAHF